MRRDPEEMGITLAFPAAVPREIEDQTGPGNEGQASPSDGELIQRVGRGDAGAFELLYRRYSRPVFGLALRRLGDRMAAEEAVQETFAALWRSARTYKPERGPGAPWLYAVARNAIVDRARNKWEPATEAPETASLELGPAERAGASYVSWRVRRALARRLPHRPGRRLEPLVLVRGRAHREDARDREGARVRRGGGGRTSGIGRQLADADHRHEPEADRRRQLLRDVAIEERQARLPVRELQHEAGCGHGHPPERRLSGEEGNVRRLDRHTPRRRRRTGEGGRPPDDLRRVAAGGDERRVRHLPSM